MKTLKRRVKVLILMFLTAIVGISAFASLTVWLGTLN